MIKFATTGDRTTLIGLGITEGNVEGIKAGQPILVKGSELGFDWLEIMIFYGETEDKLLEMLKNANISIDRLIDRREDK